MIKQHEIEPFGFYALEINGKKVAVQAITVRRAVNGEKVTGKVKFKARYSGDPLTMYEELSLEEFADKATEL